MKTAYIEKVNASSKLPVRFVVTYDSLDEKVKEQHIYSSHPFNYKQIVFFLFEIKGYLIRRPPPR